MIFEDFVNNYSIFMEALFEKSCLNNIGFIVLRIVMPLSGQTITHENSA